MFFYLVKIRLKPNNAAVKTVLVPRETQAGETRCALTPSDVKVLVSLGFAVRTQAGLGLSSLHTDDAYRAAGAAVVDDLPSALSEADLVLRVRKPPVESVPLYNRGAFSLSFLDPFAEKPLVEALAAAGVSAASLEMIPRTTLAQKMDALSSQSNLAGYAAVILAASRLPSIFPMLMTPAGTLNPARVFIIGAGVAGLQAIATAKRLGARVEAYDTRAVVEEQVRSLGAKFVSIDLGETGQTEQGYAKALTPEQLEKQRAGMVKACALADVVITTAKVFGRKSPVLLTSAMLEHLRPGTFVIDLAVESGGNVEGARPGETLTTPGGVHIVGAGALECTLPVHASQMLSANLTAFLTHFWDAGEKSFKLRLEDDILKGCLLTHAGAIVHPCVRS